MWISSRGCEAFDVESGNGNLWLLEHRQVLQTWPLLNEQGMLHDERICFTIGATGWPSLLCHVLKSTWDRAVRANELETDAEEDLKPRLGNLYKPHSMVPWRRIFCVFLSLIKRKVGWNSKNELLSWQNFETLIKFVAKWGTWSACCNLNVLWGVWRHVEPTWKMESCLPSPMVTLSWPWYGWGSTRWSLF